MGFSEIPQPPVTKPGQDGPHLRVPPPGPQSRTWLLRYGQHAAPMGPTPKRGRMRGVIVHATANGSNVIDVDGNRYVDLAAGFGSMLLGHAHPRIAKVLALQGERMLQALGDLHPSDARVALSARLTELFGRPARVILGQSGADAVTAALKTALLATGKPGVVAFEGAYHGLSYAPLSVTSLREGYREPFVAQLSPHTRTLSYPADEAGLELTLERVRFELLSGEVGAVVVEPIMGRGGVVVPPSSFVAELVEIAHKHGALVIADEVWTGLGRSGHWLMGSEADIVCLAKGLGGGLPISACIGTQEVMAAWRREPEVVHTSTFAGAPIACATAIATLDTLKREELIARSADVGERFLQRLRQDIGGLPAVRDVRGVGLMIGVDLGDRPGAAGDVMCQLLESGFLATTGGGARESVVFTPPLNIDESLLFSVVQPLVTAVAGLGP